jgi:predicted dinucleotide-binding enzyme
VFAQNMASGKANGMPLSLLVAGDHDGAKKQVSELC